MNRAAFWIIVCSWLVSTGCLLQACGTLPPIAEQKLLGAIDWAHPEYFTWYSGGEAVTWENPRYVKYRDKDNIEIVSKDGVVFGIYGRTLSQFKKQ